MKIRTTGKRVIISMTHREAIYIWASLYAMSYKICPPNEKIYKYLETKVFKAYEKGGIL